MAITWWLSPSTVLGRVALSIMIGLILAILIGYGFVVARRNALAGDEEEEQVEQALEQPEFTDDSPEEPQ